MSTLTLRLPGGESLEFQARRLVMLGYTGRDQDAVRAHIEELKHEGVPPPPSVPLCMPVPARNLGADGEIDVVSPRTSGEAEAVLLLHRGRLFVAAGSDHTDRELERHSILQSKQTCPKLLGAEVWPFDEVRAHWDRLELKSWTDDGRGGERLYQAGTLGMLLPPERLLELAREVAGQELNDGLAVFGGTVPVQGGELICGGRFRAELRDPVRGRALKLDYRIRTLAGAV